MVRLFFLAAIFSFSLAAASCHSACHKAQARNGRLVTGQETFGMKKNSKYKRQNRRSAW